MLKKYILFVCLFSVLQNTHAQNEVVDKVVATVGGELVLLSEIEEQYALMKDQQESLPENVRCQIVAQTMGAKLLLNQAKLDSILVDDSEVEAQLNARIDRILNYMQGDMKQFEDYYGQTVNEVKEQFREDLKNQILVERERSSIIQSINITPSEVKDFFNKIPKDSLPYFNSEVEVGEIVYYPKVNTSERQRALDTLTNVRKKIVVDSIDFAQMALKYSDDGSARAGGDLGWAKRGSFVPEFEATAYNLEPGEVSDIVETEFGFHIIQLLERRGNQIHTRHILIKPDITNDDLQLAFNHLDSVKTLVKNDSISFSFAVKQFSTEEVQSYNNDGRMVNPITGNTFFEIGDLDPDIYFTIDTMDVGEISAPFGFKDLRGENAFRLVQLQSRTAPHRADLALDYAKIRKAAREAKQSEFIAKWVDEKVNSTYVNLDKIYNGCPNLASWRKVADKP